MMNSTHSKDVENIIDTFSFINKRKTFPEIITLKMIIL